MNKPSFISVVFYLFLLLFAFIVWLVSIILYPDNFLIRILIWVIFIVGAVFFLKQRYQRKKAIPSNIEVKSLGFRSGIMHVFTSGSIFQRLVLGFLLFLDFIFVVLSILFFVGMIVASIFPQGDGGFGFGFGAIFAVIVTLISWMCLILTNSYIHRLSEFRKNSINRSTQSRINLIIIISAAIILLAFFAYPVIHSFLTER